MFCKFCGKEIRDSAVFCKYCGKKVAEEPATATPEKQEEGEPVEPVAEAQKTTKEPQPAEPQYVKTEQEAQEEKTTQPAEEISESSAIEYKDYYIDGKHFVYKDSPSVLFCPKCHKPTDKFASACFKCDASFTNGKNENEESTFKPAETKRTTEKHYSETSEFSAGSDKTIGIVVAIVVIFIFFLAVVNTL